MREYLLSLGSRDGSTSLHAIMLLHSATTKLPGQNEYLTFFYIFWTLLKRVMVKVEIKLIFKVANHVDMLWLTHIIIIKPHVKIWLQREVLWEKNCIVVTCDHPLKLTMTM